MRYGKPIIKRQDRINYIINGVSSYYGIRGSALARPSKVPAITRAKHIAIKLLREYADISLKETVIAMGMTTKGQHHISTIINKLDDRLDPNLLNDEPLRKEYSEIIQRLGL